MAPGLTRAFHAASNVTARVFLAPARPGPRSTPPPLALLPPDGPGFRIRGSLHIVSSVNDVCETDTAAGPVAAASALLTAIGAVRRTARRAVQQAWDQEPLPPARSELLLLVARRPGITVAEAAHELHLAQNTISTLVSKLAAERLLDRGTDTADRRAVRLTVAPAGRARLAGYRDLRAELAGRALAGLTTDDQQALAAAVPALRRLAGQLESR